MPLPQGYERYDSWLHGEAEKAWEEECDDDMPDSEDDGESQYDKESEDE